MAEPKPGLPAHPPFSSLLPSAGAQQVTPQNCKEGLLGDLPPEGARCQLFPCRPSAGDPTVAAASIMKTI